MTWGGDLFFPSERARCSRHVAPATGRRASRVYHSPPAEFKRELPASPGQDLPRDCRRIEADQRRMIVATNSLTGTCARSPAAWRVRWARGSDAPHPRRRNRMRAGWSGSGERQARSRRGDPANADGARAARAADVQSARRARRQVQSDSAARRAAKRSCCSASNQSSCAFPGRPFRLR